MTNQLILPGELVKKHNDLIRTKIDVPSVHGSRILANLIACLKVEDNYFVPISISAKEVMNSGSGENYKRVKNVIEELAQATAQVEIQDPDDPFPFLTVCPFFSRITYNKGVIKAEFNEYLRDFLLRLKKHFTQYNLLEYMLLLSTYSQRFFEILKSWSNLPEVEIYLEEIHRLLSTPESMQKNYAKLRTKILEPVHKEIIQKTNFFYEWKPIKKGTGKTSPVVAVRFNFIKQKEKSILSVTKKEYKITPDQQEISKENNNYFKKVLSCDYYKKREAGEECLITKARTKKCIVCNRILKNKFEAPLFD